MKSELLKIYWKAEIYKLSDIYSEKYQTYLVYTSGMLVILDIMFLNYIKNINLIKSL